MSRRPKLGGQVFKRTWQSEDRDLYYVLVGFVYPAIFLPKRQIKSLSEQCWKVSIWKILKVKQKLIFSRQLYVACARGKT